jgi:hypothetical protein
MGQIISEKFKGKEFSRRIITTDVIIAGTIAGGVFYSWELLG